MRKCLNKVTIEGRLFSHSLELRPGSKNHPDIPFIMGDIEIATDDECLNVVPVHYSYVTEFTKAGKQNITFISLKKLIESGKTVGTDGKAEATIVRATPSLALNDYYVVRESRFGSMPRNEGGFLSILSDSTKLKEKESDRSKFEVDGVITNVTHVDADPEKNIDKDFVSVKAAIFNFRNDLMPFNFVVKSQGGMDYFEGLDASGSNPVFLNFWGEIKNAAIKTEKATESAFGEAKIDTVTRYVREWVITGASTNPFDFGDEAIMTSEELKNMIAAREIMLAEVKKNAEDYASQNSNVPTPAVAPKSVAEAAAAAAKTASFDF